MADLVQDREAVVEEVVEDVVEEVAGALAEQRFLQGGVVPAALEQARDRQQLDVGKRDQIVRAEEEVELARVQSLDGLVVDREVQDGEQVLGVVVDLRALTLREHVLDVERVPAETLRERGCLLGVGRVEVDPGEPVVG